MTISELRTDPISGRQVLIAEDRAGRPSDFAAQELGRGEQTECPFCAGHECLTPEALFEFAGASGEWQVRVVPNKYPAVSMEQQSSLQPRTSALGATAQPPEGVHEVFIESPRHVQDITELSSVELALVLRAYRERLRFWSTDECVQHATIFKNVGVAAGASLEHVHSQLLALPNIPPMLAAEMESSQRYYADKKVCVFCQLIEEELTHRQRLVVDAGSFVAFCAYAGRQPFETWILPRKHSARFDHLSDEDTVALAEILQQIVGRLQAQLSPLSYNLILHTAPFSQRHVASYHWHFELVPRSTTLAGFEWGTGMFINPLSPERAAGRLCVE
ncbi:MAG: galactose-1-phosphate uridylyltransferase [Planctomycetes bacterium]|nr:galactose-1-phosphate uridylyltransferase [Planctomycetota bacterium]